MIQLKELQGKFVLLKKRINRISNHLEEDKKTLSQKAQTETGINSKCNECNFEANNISATFVRKNSKLWDIWWTIKKGAIGGIFAYGNCNYEDTDCLFRHCQTAKYTQSAKVKFFMWQII